jgi:probable rRNA maturation factor
MPINILNQNPSVRVPLKRLRRSLQRISTVLRVRGDLNVLLVSDPEILRYNRRFLKHDYVTDVIAFEMNEEGVFGDVVISTDTAKRQSKEEGHGILTETKILAIHGLLHLLGYRDKKKKDHAAMWKKTDELLETVRRL